MGKRLVCANCGAVADPKKDARCTLSGVLCARTGKGKGCHKFSTWIVTCSKCGRVVEMHKDAAGIHFVKEIKPGAKQEGEADA